MTTNQMSVTDKPLTPELLGKMDAYWRAADYLSVGQIYLHGGENFRRTQDNQVAERTSVRY
jgi:phosphoketolase